MIARWALCLALVAAAAEAQETSPPPETSPAPEARPEGLVPEQDEASDSSAAAPVETPDPEARPSDLDRDEGEGAELAPVAPVGPGVYEALAETEQELAACLTELDALGTVYTVDAPVTAEDRDCGIANPITVSELRPGVAVSPPAQLRCAAARSAAIWLRDFVQPAAERLGRGEVVTIRNGSGYVCRRRNNAADGKLSEHSFGNALDVMGFEFAEGDPVAVQPRERDGTMAEAFQDAVRASACLEFTTVLGPGSDAAHADHLHLDVIERRGGFRLCQ